MHCSWQRLARRFVPLALGAILALAGCGREADRATGASPAAARTPTAAEAEAEEIRQLLAYAIAGAGWDTEARVGHNMAAVLVTPDGMPVWWERNANFAQHSSIEHAEARLLTSYIGDRRELGRPVPRLAGYSVYSTLEPGHLADLLIIQRRDAEPYRAVVTARPSDVRLVMVGGTPVYGATDLMAQLRGRWDVESVEVCGAAMRIDTTADRASLLDFRHRLSQVSLRLSRGLTALGRGIPLAPIAECP